MKKLVIIFVLIGLNLYTYGQFKKNFPKTAYGFQYAGSIGYISVGYFRLSPKEKLALGALYGRTPQFAGGPLNSLTMKCIYTPFRKKLSSRFFLEPLQTGLFASGWFGEKMDMSWSGNYPKRYYWWHRNVRSHIFVSTQVSMNVKKKIERVSLYFEVNTNDLYLYNY
ncbi:MAG: hypothetical protein HY305_04710, partial [Sphingobacteriales bacterium]|nr:hypothetical protein [Sphingobacteriales bacterium]